MAATTAVIVVPPMPPWDPIYNDPRYKCCCNTCHVQSGAVIIGTLEAIGIGLCVLSAIGSMGNRDSGSSLGILIYCLIVGIILFFLFWGIKTERASLLIPHLVLQALRMVALGLVTLVGAVGLAVGGGLVAYFATHVKQQHQMSYNYEYGEAVHEKAKAAEEGLALAAVLFFTVMALCLAWELWYFLVVLNCYRYLKAKEDYKRSQLNEGFTGLNGVSVPAVQQAIPTYPMNMPQTSHSYPADQGPPAYDFGQQKQVI